MPLARQNGGKRKRSLKNQIRGLTRLLRREDLKHDARVRRRLLPLNPYIALKQRKTGQSRGTAKGVAGKKGEYREK